MAQSYVSTGTQLGLREDLADFIKDVNYKKTPYLTMIGKSESKAILHEWMEDVLQQGVVGTNTKAEGFTPSYASTDNDIRVRRSNNLEIIARLIQVSRSLNKVDKAGLGQRSEYDKQLERRIKELASDLNITLWQQTPVTRVADSATAGQMKGYFNIATIHNRNAGGAIITDDLLNSLLQEMVEDGVDPDFIFCSGFNKRAISSWVTPSRRYANDETTIVDRLEKYDGDWGVQSIVYDKHVPTTQVAVFQMDQMKVSYLDPFEHVHKSPLESTIDGEQGYVLTEATLEFGAQKAAGQINNLKTG